VLRVLDMLTINKKSISATLKMTASDWELYESLPYAESVANELNRKFEQCLAEGMSADEIYSAMYTLMVQHKAFGAADSEPHYKLISLIQKIDPEFD